MDKWTYFGLFLTFFSIGEIANKLNINLNTINGVFQHTDNPILIFILTLSYVIALACLFEMYLLARNEVKNRRP